MGRRRTPVSGEITTEQFVAALPDGGGRRSLAESALRSLLGPSKAAS
ncbi:MAG: hypothetical protein M3N95_08350 [Actinomycetota bacterium]|nr:hypothetical protein [Actinomycetota bacterium]